MARVHGRAHAFGEKVNWGIGDRPEWRLIFKEGWERKLRIGGYYAGHATLSALKEALFKEAMTQQLRSASCSRTYGGDGVQPSSLAPLSIKEYAHVDDDGENDDVDEFLEHHKRRKTTLGASEGEDGVRSDRHKLDGGRNKPYTTRVDNLSTSHFSSEAYPEFGGEENSRSLSGKLARNVLAIINPHESYRGREGSASGGHNANDGARSSLGDRGAPETVADMFVLKCADRLVPITNLPICIGGNVSGGIGDQDIFLTGRFWGRTKSFPVDMWKLLLSPGSEPCLMVKTTKGVWLRLLKPQACYLKTISDGYVLAHFLDYVKKNPSAAVMEVEEYLARECSMYGHDPSLEKLSKHLRVIRSFVEEDEDLKNASVLRAVFPNLFTKNSAGLRGDSSQQSRQVLRSVLGLNGPRAQDETGMDDRREDRIWGGALYADDGLLEEYVPEGTPADQGTKKKKSIGTCGFEWVVGEDKKLKRSRTPKLDHERHGNEDAKKDRRKSRSAVGGSRLQAKASNMVSEVGASKSKGERKSSQRAQKKTKELDDPPVCVLCDDGGDLLICDGPCSRYFHSFPGTGSESFCQTLGLSRKETKAERWYCKNCEQKQHQCFICGELGSTDAVLGRPEVYMCEVPSCKRFYHAHCVAELVDFPNWRTKANGIRNGTERLICPRHKCDTCRLTEMTPGRLVQCRRCPKAWHRECFQNYSLSGEHRTTTIWNHDQQEFVYCRQHKVNPTLMTPDRDHIRFPGVAENNKMKKSRVKSTGLDGTIIERQYYETLPPTPLAAEMGLLNQ